MIHEYFYWAISICIVACAVARQLIRECLVNSLLKHKHHLSLEVSNWITSGNGYVSALKACYVWGSESDELLSLPYSRRYVIAFRCVDLFGIGLLCVGIGALLFEFN